MAASLYASPEEALKAPPEEFLYLACLHEGTGVRAPDFIAVVDAEEGRVVHEMPMPNVGDELHHFGWNRCSSACHGPDRSHLIVPGFRSSRIHVVNVADDPRSPRIERVIEAQEIVEKTGYTRPHTVHCMPGDNIVISMLGDADGNGACGFAVLDARTFELKGRWEDGGERPRLNYDFWYQPRQNVLASSEFGEPNAYESGFDLDDVAAGRYGSRLHFWNLSERRVEQTLELGETGLLPFEVRWLHDPDADEGFVGAALSSTMWHFHRENGAFEADQAIAVDSVELEGWPFPVPGLITDLVVSMDDRFLYFSDWLRPSSVRRLRPGESQAHRPVVAGRRAGEAVRCRTRAARRPADDPALLRRAAALRDELAVLDLGQPVLPRSAVLAPARQLPSRRRHGDRPRLLRRLPRPPRRSRASPRGPAPGRRLHHGDLPVSLSFAHIGGLPIEETLGSLGPAVLVILGAMAVKLRARMRS
jgi:selenium-binding protein 1